MLRLAANKLTLALVSTTTAIGLIVFAPATRADGLTFTNYTTTSGLGNLSVRGV